MKLKKIASLALAGIMAVSMLAGCKNDGSSNGNNDNSEEVVVSTGLAGQVIDALNANTTKNVDFSAASDRLNLALEIALEKNGSNSLNSFAGSDVWAVDATLASTNRLEARESNGGYTSADGTDSQKQTALFVVTATAGNDESGAYKLAAEIDDVTPMKKSGGEWQWKELPERSLSKAAAGTADNYCWSFEYTAEVAATKVVNTTTNEVTYVAAVLVTRTPTKTSV